MSKHRWRRAAFIYYNQMAFPGQLESVPFAFNTLKLLADEADRVDAYLWEPEDGLQNLFPPNVKLHSRSLPHHSRWNHFLLRFIKFYPFALRLRFLSKYQYDVVFTVGQIGSYIGEIISASSRCPLVYLNDEFPDTTGHQQKWIRLEKHAAAAATVVVVPDKSRIAPLLGQLQCEPPFVIVIANSPLTSEPPPEIDWAARLNIRDGLRPFLYAGSLHDWMQIPELLQSVNYWPIDTVLILQSALIDPAYRKQLSHLDIEGRIIWSDEQISEPELNSLIQFCYGCFALYRNVDDNMLYMGHASGKIMRSIALGTPVITSNFTSLDFVTENGLGYQVNHPGDIPDRISLLLENRERLGKNCLEYFEKSGRFEHGWESLLTTLKSAATNQSKNQN